MTDRKTKSHFLQVLMVIVIIASPASISITEGRPEYVKILPADLKNFCIVCHQTNTGSGLNQFGRDYASIDEESLMRRDSDGDGYSNGDELNAGKFPGDPKSYPGGGETNRLYFMGLQGILIISVFLIFRYVLKTERLRY